MQKHLKSLTLAGVSLTPLFAIADLNQAQDIPKQSDAEITSDRENNLEVNIPPENVAISAPPEFSDTSDRFSTPPAQSLAEAPWLLESLTPTVEFSENNAAQADSHSRSQGTPPETTAIEFTPRMGVGYTTSDGGYDSLTSIQGFLPLQTSPHDLFFLEGNWRFDNGNNDRLEGITAILGYRTFAAKSDRIWGGYVAYDKQTTDFSVFHQLGLGFETLGNVDFRVNGYIPLGQSRNLYAQNSFDTGTQYSDLYFRDRYLMYDTLRMFGETRFYEMALGGFDAELGVKLLSFGAPSQDLRLYGGAYYYSGEGVTPAWGWRTRLEARPTDLFNLGLSLQQDDLFGTNLAFTFGVRFPSHRRQRKLEENETNLPRLADSVRRNPTIAVTSDTETEITTERETEVLAKNPATGQPWIFRHVTLGATGGDGTFERPFGTVREGLNTSLSDGNHIVYVDLEADINIPGFSIPDRVQVLSRGPVQPLDTIQFGNISIPLSGTGEYPTIRGTSITEGAITGMVALGNHSTLSGFTIQADGNNGIIGENIMEAIARDNQVFNSDRGIHLRGNGGTISVTLLRNSISDAARQGIFFDAFNEGAIVNSAILNNFISDTINDGIRIEAMGNARLENIAISGNTIRNIPDGQSDFADGIDVFISEGATANNILISNNTIANIPDDGINVGIHNKPSFGGNMNNITIANNTISNVGFNSHACGTGIELFNSSSNAQIFSNINLFNNYIQDALDSSITIDSIAHADKPKANQGGRFTIARFENNTSINPLNGIDLGFLLGKKNGASVEFIGLGTVQFNNDIASALESTIQNNNNFAANISWTNNINRKKCPTLK
jgi:hypothetical protein